MLTDPSRAWVLHHTQAQEITSVSLIQNLWGGYGQLLRLHLPGSTVILKQVVPPEAARASVSDQRKRCSYQVEQAWYQSPAQSCDDTCRVARCLGQEGGEASLLLLEDLSASGYLPTRPPRTEHLAAGLTWLAHFHARFMGQSPAGLWGQGSYWHLKTRQDEWQRMPAGPLKTHAARFDAALRAARFQTLMHGDSKPSNFLWHSDGSAAAVDFQYVGPGCGIRDVSYFLDSCLGEDGCQRDGERWLDHYFRHLTSALKRVGKGQQASDVEAEWRRLFPVAWTDYARFYEGWGRAGGLGPYSLLQLERALQVS